MNITKPSYSISRWRLQVAEFNFEVHYNNEKDDHHDVVLPRLLNVSPTVEDEADELSSFLLEEAYTYIHLETIDLNGTVAFIENDFDEMELLLATKEAKSPLSSRLP